ncbi:MAG: hypothetical protein A3E78_16560 [Alphaproteobacteria bacterium RIFCSPHIGHO2_12_FULL_63_12]|nr:MAG: hypothetical protein A3E78_16560 [Alphaproteobacteria bacterium RIFCSPHIGHO2_12_FULL_63_12]
MSLVTEARVLLHQFLKTDYKALRASTPTIEIFFSRDAAFRADMQEAAVRGTDVGAAEPIETPAPHLGTIAALAANGETIAAGGVCGRIRVLDDEFDLTSEQAGIVIDRRADIGDLVEYGQPVLVLQKR